MNLVLSGRKGYFLAVNPDGFESDFLNPANADAEANGFRVGPARVVWVFWDEELSRGIKPPVYHPVAPVAPSIGVWAVCEVWLLEQETQLALGRAAPRL